MLAVVGPVLAAVAVSRGYAGGSGARRLVKAGAQREVEGSTVACQALATHTV